MPQISVRGCQCRRGTARRRRTALEKKKRTNVHKRLLHTRQSQSDPSASRQVCFPHRHGYGAYNLVLENKSLHSLKHPERDEEDTDILYPGKFDGFPEARPVGGGKRLRKP